MKIGYARVSTTDQNLELQLTTLTQAGCERIYQEKISGAKRDRPELQRLLDHLRPNDIVVVWKLDRLARSTRNLLDIVESIKESQASFRSLSEPWADTTSHAGKMIMIVFAGIAEFERDLIRERTSAGREAALERGVRFGRPDKLSEEKKALAMRFIEEGKSVMQIADTFNVNRNTIYRLIEKWGGGKMTEEDMKIAGIFRDENGRYHARPRSKEEQERINEYQILRDKCFEELNKLYETNPTQEDLENFSKFLAEQNQKRPDYIELNKLARELNTFFPGMIKTEES